MRIRRTKTGEGGPDGLPPSTVTQWARVVDRSGTVVIWGSEQDAIEFDEATAHKVREQYANRPLAGKLDFVGTDGKAARFTPAPPSASGGEQPSEEEFREAIAEIYRRGDTIKQQQEVIERLQRELADLMPSGLDQSSTVTTEPKQQSVRRGRPTKSEES